MMNVTWNFSPNLFIPAVLLDTIDFLVLPLNTTSQWPWSWLRVMRSAQSKTCWVHFLTHFLVWEDELWRGVEATRVEHPDTNFDWDLVCIMRNNCCFTMFKNLGIGMHSYVCEPIWFKLGLINPAELYILILVCCCWDLLVWWTSCSFHLVWVTFKGRTLLMWVHQTKALTLACIWTSADQFL